MSGNGQELIGKELDLIVRESGVLSCLERFLVGGGTWQIPKLGMYNNQEFAALLLRA